MKNCVVVTGASGYIGGQTVLALKEAGRKVVGIDMKPANESLCKSMDRFFQEDFSSSYSLQLLEDYQPIAVIHCAGTSLVGPSIKSPELYYRNNVVKTKALLDHIVKRRLPVRVIFSSSAATYGEPLEIPCRETDPPRPVSPYGESKLMVEMILRSYQQAYDLDFVALRYFNACGADPRARHGQEPGATHIIARVLESMLQGKTFVLNGDQYATDDGTCVRDYVHVADIARAHVLSLQKEITAGIYNLGSNQGYSNRQIIEAARRIVDRPLTESVGPKREGDPAVLTASAEKFSAASGWTPEYGLDDMIRHAWAWYNR